MFGSRCGGAALAIGAVVMFLVSGGGGARAVRGGEPPVAVPELPVEVLLERLTSTLPDHVVQLSRDEADEIVRILRQIDAASAAISPAPDSPEQALDTVRRLSATAGQLERLRRAALDRRFDLSAMAPGIPRAAAIGNFLEVNDRLLDVSGRVNAELRDAARRLVDRFADRPEALERLVRQIAADECRIGTAALAFAFARLPLGTPDTGAPDGTDPKRQVLELLARHGPADALPAAVQTLEDPAALPELVLAAAEAILHMGLPQDLPPRQKARRGLPRPPVTAGGLSGLLETLDGAALSPSFEIRRARLLAWLAERQEAGIGAEGYVVDGVTLRPGDWILMRNTSPYNRFTDLQPGLFTHAGLVARLRDADGVHRMVLVDVTERRPRVRAENVERVLAEPAYFAVLRHDDPAAARRMGEAAAALAGNPLEFDRSFDLARVDALRGQPLEGRKIHTYCAGLLAIAAQETGLPRTEFFPLPEGPANARVVQNLEELGIRIGDDFVSPTGALFSRRLGLVHWSTPLYDAGRDVEQRIYDHFAARMERERIAPRPNLFQALRQELAEASRTNPMLAQALAALAGVHPDTDLAEAARAAAVVESLDAAAETSRAEFEAALAALAPLAASPPALSSGEEGSPAARHADLVALLRQGRVDRRGLNDALVAWYAERGCRRVDELFFARAAK